MREILGELIGNDKLKNIISADAAHGKNAHAYIIEGPSGSGKRTAAELICKTMLCENRERDSYPLPCGECPICRRISGGTSVDVMRISNGDKASIGVDAVREIKNTLYITPNDGDKKIYIIENAHLMTTQAQNALLLSLEEPPAYAVFLLLAEDSAMLLETVRSRAPTIKMELFSPMFIVSELKKLKNLTPVQKERIDAAAHMCGGRLGYAMELIKNGDAELSLYSSAEKLTSLLLTGSTTEAISYVNSSIPKEREKTRRLLALVMTALRDIISLKKGGDAIFYSEKPAFSGKVSVKRVIEVLDAVIAADSDIAANCSQNTVMTSLVCGVR